MESLHFRDEKLGGNEEDAAVPVMVARRDIGLGARAVGFFDERRDLEAAGRAGNRAAAPDIAVARFRPLRINAEGDEPPLARRFRRTADRGAERGHVGDRVVRRHDEQQRILLALEQQQRGDRDRGRGIAAHRLEHDGARRDRGQAELLGDHEAVLVVRDDEGGCEDAFVGDAKRRLLEQAALRHERQELLRVKRPRHRPKPGPRAAGQDHGVDPRRHAIHGHVPLDAKLRAPRS